jgi:hypothetical protein
MDGFDIAGMPDRNVHTAIVGRTIAISRAQLGRIITPYFFLKKRS